jgi:hypothetical protein
MMSGTSIDRSDSTAAVATPQSSLIPTSTIRLDHFDTCNTLALAKHDIFHGVGDE